jgi:hypothetical protein
LGEFTLGNFLKNAEVALILGYIFSPGKSYELILTKAGLGNILGDFLANSSLHPDLQLEVSSLKLIAVHQSI